MIRGYTRQDVEKLYNPASSSGVKGVTPEMSAGNDEEILTFGDVSSKMSFQTDGDLEVDVFVSVNGTTWVDTAANATAAAIISYSAHNIMAVRFVHVSGTGKVHLAGSM